MSLTAASVLQMLNQNKLCVESTVLISTAMDYLGNEGQTKPSGGRFEAQNPEFVAAVRIGAGDGTAMVKLAIFIDRYVELGVKLPIKDNQANQKRPQLDAA
ncbi:uncharacterized protein LOC115261051 [Aedes albopictus]|uniref:Uncharacterized protein n=1 Tax=Aedes albopictus TaxID=7160 RepID=A0ABM1Z0F8_AEDAL|nr:uncharacterized protein LOC115261051 [Aedes albopictus]